MKQLYSKEAKESLLKIKKSNFKFILSFAFLIVIVLLLTLILATFKTRLIFDIVSSILLTCFSICLAFFIAKAIRIKSLLYDFCYVEEDKGKKVKCKVVRVSKNLVTLPDKLKVYEVEVEFDDGSGKIYSISEMFEPELIEESNYNFVIVSDYIKEYEEYEN